MRTGEEGIRCEENRRGRDKMGTKAGEEGIIWEREQEGKDKMGKEQERKE